MHAAGPGPISDNDKLQAQRVREALQLPSQPLTSILMPNEVLRVHPMMEQKFLLRGTRVSRKDEGLKLFQTKWFPLAKSDDPEFPDVWPVPTDRFHDPTFWGLEAGDRSSY